MARFDLHRAPAGTGYVLDVQDNLHDHLATRVVVPLLPATAAPAPSRGLNPAFDLDGVAHILFPQFLAAVPKRELGWAVGSLAAERDAVTRALDILFTGV